VTRVTEPALTILTPATPVRRVGFKPEPWAWAGWEWATGGQVHGRWDDAAGLFRTVYAAPRCRPACLRSSRASARTAPCSRLSTTSPRTRRTPALHPTATAGQVPYSWLARRAAAAAQPTGSFCAVTTAASTPRSAPRSSAKPCDWDWATSTPLPSRTDARPQALYAAGRLIVRRVKRLNPAGDRQGELFNAYRYHAVFTDSSLELPPGRVLPPWPRGHRAGHRRPQERPDRPSTLWVVSGQQCLVGLCRDGVQPDPAPPARWPRPSTPRPPPPPSART